MIVLSRNHLKTDETRMSDVTQILSAIEGGDAQAAERLLPLIYEELRKLAAEIMRQKCS